MLAGVAASFAASIALGQQPIHTQIKQRHAVSENSCGICRYVVVRRSGPDEYLMTWVGSKLPEQKGQQSSEEFVLLFDGRGGVSPYVPKSSPASPSDSAIRTALKSSGAEHCHFSSATDGEFAVEYHAPGRVLQEIDGTGILMSQAVAQPIAKPHTFYVFRNQSGGDVLCGTMNSPRIFHRLVRDTATEKPDFAEAIKRQVEAGLRAYLNIPTIPEPELPPAPVLKKDEFEKTEAFNRRVDIARQKREESIHQLQQDFRRRVEQRNQLIGSRQASLAAYTDQLTKQAALDALGNLLLRNPEYDADKEVMYADLVSTKTNFSRQIAFRVPIEGDQARDFKNRVADSAISLRLNVGRDSISVREASAAIDGKTYPGLPVTAQEKVTGVLAKSIDLKALDAQLGALSVPTQMQSPDLVDKKIGKLRYDDGGIVDDVRGAVSAMRTAPADPTRWLFILAVENYDNADPVLYARNSAELVRETFQRKFGIPARNTYALIDDKATAGAFKDKLTLMLNNIKPGDTIYFYYSGHGIPDQKSEESYILPRDREVSLVANDEQLRLSKIYAVLTESKAARVYAFVDSCFSGKTDNISNFKGVAPGVFRTRDVLVDGEKVVVFTAGKNNQFSNVYAEHGHRMFSYFLLKSLLKPRPAGAITVKALYEDIAVGVRDASYAKGDAYIQEPQLLGNLDAPL